MARLRQQVAAGIVGAGVDMGISAEEATGVDTSSAPVPTALGLADDLRGKPMAGLLAGGPTKAHHVSIMSEVPR